MAEVGAVSPPLQTAAAAREKTKLRKVLGRADLVLFTACAILGFDTVAEEAVLNALAGTLDVGIPYPLPTSNSMPSQETTPARPNMP